MTTQFTPMSQMGPQPTASQVDGQIEEQPTESMNVEGGQPGQAPTTASQVDGQITPNMPPQAPVGSFGPKDLHKGLFSKILEGLNGGPVNVYDTNPETGETVRREVPQTKASLSKSILAGAIAGMLAPGGEQYMDSPQGPIRVNNLSQAGANGAQAAAAQRDKARQQAQQQMDEPALRQANVLKRNLELYQQMTSAQNVRYDSQKKMADDNKPILDSLRESDSTNTDPSMPKFILESGVTSDDLMKKFHVTRNNAILDGWREAIDPETGKPMLDKTGQPQYEPTFTAINPEAIITMTPGMKEQYSKLNPDIARIPDNMPIKAKAILDMVHTSQDRTIGSSVLQHMMDSETERNDGKSKATATVDELMGNPIIKKALKYINKYAGDDPDEIIKGLRSEKDPNAQQAAGLLATKLNIDHSAWETKRAQDAVDVKRKEDEKPADQNLVSSFESRIKAQNPELSDRVVKSLKDELGANPTVKVLRETENKALSLAVKEQVRADKNQPEGEDEFGFHYGSGLSTKDYESRYQKFSKSYVEGVNRLAKTNMEFNRILGEKTMTAADRVTALLAAVGISGNPLQGKGFRISQQIIDEHAHARPLYESAVQRLNAIAGTGGPITAQQVKDYASIARGVVHDEYVTAAQEARRQNLPVNFMPRGGGQKIDKDTVRIFVDSANGDPRAAERAAKAAGWVF